MTQRFLDQLKKRIAKDFGVCKLKDFEKGCICCQVNYAVLLIDNGYNYNARQRDRLHEKLK